MGNGRVRVGVILRRCLFILQDFLNVAPVVSRYHEVGGFARPRATILCVLLMDPWFGQGATQKRVPAGPATVSHEKLRQLKIAAVSKSSTMYTGRIFTFFRKREGREEGGKWEEGGGRGKELVLPHPRWW